MKISLICLALCLSCVPRLPELEPTKAISLLDLRGQYETGVEGTIATLPLRGARVELVGVGLVTHTGDNGEFVFLQIPASALANRLEFLVFDPIALESDPPIGRFVETISDTAVGSVTFAKKIVNPRGALIGRVDLVGDENNGGVLVYAEGLPGVDDLTGLDGTFILLGIPEGAVRIHANRAGFVPTPTAVEFQAQAYARLPIEEIILLNPIPGERLTASTGGRVITADGQIPEGCEVWAIPQISGDAEIAMVRMAVSPEGRFNAPLNYDEPHQLILKSQGKLTSARLLQVQPGRQDLVLVGLPLPEGDDDRDGDGHPSSEDVDDTDPHTWADLDGDGIGDLHDWDDDGDGIADMEELCPGRDGETSDPQDESDGDPHGGVLAGGFSRMEGGNGLFWADRNPARSVITSLSEGASEAFASLLEVRRERFATQGLFGPFRVTPVEGERLQFRASGYLGSADDQIELVTLKAAHCQQEDKTACRAAFDHRHIGAAGPWIKQYPLTLEAAGRGRLKMRSDFAISEESWVWVWLPGGAAATPLCGNNVVDPGELCDDGRGPADDQCTNACRPPTCGDGIMQLDNNGELCDDGNGDGGDACTNECVAAVCGDGVHRTDLAAGDPGYEACDDGNQINIDACNAACELVSDVDDDGIGDEWDNCPETANTNQLNSDTDGMGDLCDPDDDNDGQLDGPDCAPLDPTISENCDSCGNRRVETYGEVVEACDDGNIFDGDGCATDCSGPANQPLAVGGTASCKITGPNSSTLSCWGQLYAISEVDASTEWSVPTNIFRDLSSTLKQVSLGSQHGCVILNNQLQCFGNSGGGRLGMGISEQSTERLGGPLIANGEQEPLDALKIAVGKDHSCALSQGGDVFCWGENSGGQAVPPLIIGETPVSPINFPTQVAGLSDVIDVVSGARHSCALLRSGVMKCWGDDLTMALGRPDLDGEQCAGLSDGSVVGPVLGLPDDNQVIKMAAGTYHTCALMADGALYCWGEGHLGDNASFCVGPSPTPRRVHQTDNNDEVISHFVDVAA
ncbi:MAG: hypothetical protein OSB21_09160, partial [Myxococcota bacterium]|nr:hypothetical protein [Myxococcota bacterium]